MNRANTQIILMQLLQAVPEIRDGYAQMESEYSEAAPLWTNADYEAMHFIEQANKLPRTNYHQPGMSIVMENLLVPFIINLAAEKNDNHRLTQIMDWLESLAKSDDFDTRNLVGAAVCEPLITTHQQYIARIFPYMGSETKNLCIGLFSAFRVEASTKELFGVV